VLKDGIKMSKSKGNTVDPQALIKQYGADTARLFTMFASPPEQSLEWSDAGVEGAARFLKRLWHLAYQHIDANINSGSSVKLDIASLTKQQQDMRRQIHLTIAKVSDDIGRRYTFNTAIAAVMELINALYKFEDKSDQAHAVMQEALQAIVLLLSPIIPHVAHVLWLALGHDNAVIDASWPQVDQAALVQNEIEMVVQVNGKLRGRINVAADANNETIQQLAIADENVTKHTAGKNIVKVIVVPKKLVNIVVK